MTDFDSGRENGTDDSTDLEPRDVRALTRRATVLPLGGDVFDVTTESGKSYRVDVRDGRCTCPDAKHRDPDGGCYHVRRVRYATGRTAVPAWIDTDAVDPQLGLHVDSGPRVAATDGGAEVLDAGDEPATDARPDDCSCLPSFDELPCWPCWLARFDTPNPNASDD